MLSLIVECGKIRLEKMFALMTCESGPQQSAQRRMLS